jgi:hypothetical protein
MRRAVCLSLAAIAAALFAFFLVGLFSPVATAVPAFARKTGLACSACHEVWPRLNEFGELFRDRGYRLERDRDAPVQQDPSYWPIAMRTTVGYQWLRNNLVPTDSGTVDTQTGTFGFTGLDVFAVGTLGPKLSFLITYAPGLAQSGFQIEPSNLDSDLESAFIGFHDIFDTPYLNVRVGKHAADLPVDEHRAITLTQGYNVYHFHPAGSVVTWEPGENHNGLEVYGHSELSRFRYSLSLVNENGSAIFSNNVVSNPVVWGHIAEEHLLDDGLLAAVRVGVFGSAGWHPTQNFTSTDATTGDVAAVQGTGSHLKPYYRYGGEVHLKLLSIVNPITLTGVLWGGSESAELIAGGTQDARFLGGFVEGVWTINPRLSLIGRYEQIDNTQQGDPGAPQSAGNLKSWTAAIRHTFELTSRTEAALHLELSRVGVEAADGTTPETFTAAVLFDFVL